MIIIDYILNTDDTVVAVRFILSGPDIVEVTSVINILCGGRKEGVSL